MNITTAKEMSRIAFKARVEKLMLNIHNSALKGKNIYEARYYELDSNIKNLLKENGYKIHSDSGDDFNTAHYYISW